MRIINKRSVFALMLASLMVVFVLPGSASGNIPHQKKSVPFKGTVHYGARISYEESTQESLEFWLEVADGLLDSGGKKGTPGQVVKFGGSWLEEDQPCDRWSVAAAERFDTGFPFDADTGSLKAVLELVAGHIVVPNLNGDPEACDWKDTTTPIRHDHFVGTVAFDLTVEPAGKCPKKGPKSGCNRSENLSGTFTVDLVDVVDVDPPVDGTWTWTHADPPVTLFQSWWFSRRDNGTYIWYEPFIPDPEQ